MSPAKCSTTSACNNPSYNITEIRYFGTVRLLRPKQNKVLYVNMEYMDLLPPTAPSLVFARETCTPYNMLQVKRTRTKSCRNIRSGRRVFRLRFDRLLFDIVTDLTHIIVTSLPNNLRYTTINIFRPLQYDNFALPICFTRVSPLLPSV